MLTRTRRLFLSAVAVALLAGLVHPAMAQERNDGTVVLKNGSRVSGDILSMSTVAVTVIIQEKPFKSMTYYPSEVHSVILRGSTYQYDSARRQFVAAARPSQPAARTEAARLTYREPATIWPDDYSRTYQTGKNYGWDMDTVYAIRDMSPSQVAAMRSWAMQSGHGWDGLSLQQRLPIARAYFAYLSQPRRSTTGGRREVSPGANAIIAKLAKRYFENRPGWRAAIATEAARLVRDANVKAFFQKIDPNLDDDAIDTIQTVRQGSGRTGDVSLRGRFQDGVGLDMPGRPLQHRIQDHIHVEQDAH